MSISLLEALKETQRHIEYLIQRGDAGFIALREAQYRAQILTEAIAKAEAAYKELSLPGIEMIRQERQRQIEVEGFDPDHDLVHSDESLAAAAAFYAHPDHPKPDALFPKHWDPAWNKRAKHSRVRQVAIGGALCAAEIDRLLNEVELIKQDTIDKANDKAENEG